jgi:hypothetical protein
MSMTLSHQIARMTPNALQTSPVLWIAAAAMVIFVGLGLTLPPNSVQLSGEQIEASLIGP